MHLDVMAANAAIHVLLADDRKEDVDARMRGHDA
jgi:hypothetical protein